MLLRLKTVPPEREGNPAHCRKAWSSISDKTFRHFVQKEIDSLEEAMREAKAEKADNRSIVKQLEKAKKRLETKIKDHAKRERKDDGVTFEQLGIDRIFVDEADLFKNLGFTTKMNRIAEPSQCSYSHRQ